ncbi:MAG TPA: alanine--tRNA ligase-related protein, partial [Microthrixaceae bacterium]|nr:alanine--tRNA ligase-related protein [Microthrixaceae bacterium]
TMGPDYPDIVANHSFVRQVIEREEVRFRETLKTGSAILDNELAALSPGEALPGSVAFRLHDTFGFPLELTEEVAAERGVEIDRAGFDVEMTEQRRRARDARKEVGADASAADFSALLDEFGPTEFTGREETSSVGTVLAVLGDSIVVDRTPFYAESGGQVGDSGLIETATGTAHVTDTVYGAPGLHRHVVSSIEGTIDTGQEAKLAIDAGRRDAIRRNHTGTHVLHWALREVLGDHVKQQGSLVAPDRLRFDFSHYAPVTPEQIRAIEDLANTEILDNAHVRHYETTKEHASELGAIAFFGDKYGDLVRVLEAGEHSVELCGGTHVGALGDIGPLKIISEGSIGSNIRRIEAITGTAPIERLRDREEVLGSAADRLGVATDDVLEGIDKRLAELKSLRDEVRDLRRHAAAASAGSLVDDAVDGVIVARVESGSRDELRDLAVSLRDRPGVRAVVLGSSPGGKGVAIVAAVDPSSGLDAASLIGDAMKTVGGGGGKGAEIAMAGGKDPSRLDEALDQVRAALGA